MGNAYKTAEWLIYNEKKYYTGLGICNKLELKKFEKLILNQMADEWGIEKNVAMEKDLKVNEHGYGIGTKKVFIYDAEKVDRAINETIEFYSNYYKQSEVLTKLTSPQIEAYLTPIKVPKKYKVFLRKSYSRASWQYAYRKDDVDRLVLQIKESYSNEEIASLFNVNMSMCRRLAQTSGFREVVGCEIRKYFREEVDNTLKRKKEMYKQYIPLAESYKFFDIEDTKERKRVDYIIGPNKVKRYEAPFFMMDKDHPTIRVLVKIEDVKKVAEEYKLVRKNAIEDSTYVGDVKVEDGYLIEVQINNKAYYSTREVVKRLQITSQSLALERLTSCWGVEFISISRLAFGDKLRGSKEKGIVYKLFPAQEINQVIEQVVNFRKKHYTIEEAQEKLTKTQMKYYATPLKVDEKYTLYMREDYSAIRGNLYLRSEVDELAVKIANTYTIEEIEEMFNLPERTGGKFVQAYNIPYYVGVKSRKLFSKQELDELLEKKIRFFQEYILLADINSYFEQETVSYHLISEDKIQRYEIPGYARESKANKYAVKLQDIIKLSEEFKERRNALQMNDIYGKTPLETFLMRLDFYNKWNGFDKESVFTQKSWYQYVDSWLKRTKVKGKKMDILINRLIFSSVYIVEFLKQHKKKEIYSLTTAELNLSLRGVKEYSYYTAIYNYLREVAISIDGIELGIKKQFQIGLIKPPDEMFQANENKNKNEIYNFEEYSAVFNYCIDIESRVNKSIDESNTKRRYKYLSTWLYVMLHLNNAWRNGDVKDFPKVYVEDILEQHGIKDIIWFKYNKITLETARIVVFRVVQYEIKMSKTNIRGSFFCSDVLAPAIATTILMLSVIHQNSPIYQEQLMIFGTEENQINKNILMIFFNELKVKGFRFLSTKFNKTVMTYIYHIANLSGDSKALLYAMNLRAHIEAATTTKYYLQFDVQTVEMLSEQLFRRGEFGYIPALLVNKINGGTLTFDEITEGAEVLVDGMGGVENVNYTLAVLNKLRSEKQDVYAEIDKMSVEEVEQKVINLYARNLPSKDSTDIQCLLGKSQCRYPDRKCSDCKYHIPTIYGLNSLCEELKYDIQTCQKSNSIPEIVKKSLSIERKKVIFKEAVKKFGEEYVLELIGWTREEFKDEVIQIPTVDDIKGYIKRF